jgi:hypothetical protein
METPEVTKLIRVGQVNHEHPQQRHARLFNLKQTIAICEAQIKEEEKYCNVIDVEYEVVEPVKEQKYPEDWFNSTAELEYRKKVNDYIDHVLKEQFGDLKGSYNPATGAGFWFFNGDQKT